MLYTFTQYSIIYGITKVSYMFWFNTDGGSSAMRMLSEQSGVPEHVPKWLTQKNK